MLPKDTWHLLQRPNHKRAYAENHHIKHIGPYEDILATVKRRKLKCYGHVTRSDGLIIRLGRPIRRYYREQSKAVEEEAGRKRAGSKTSRSGPAKHSLRRKLWHTTGMSGEN